MIGRDERGNWVVQDLKGMCGGLFVNRDAALRYARSENGNRPQTVVMVSSVIELDMTCKPAAPSQRKVAAADPQRLRRIA